MLFLLVTFLLACGSAESTNEGTTPATTSPTPQAIPASNAASPTTPANAVTNTQPAENPDIKIQIAGVSQGRARLIGIFQERQYLADSASIGTNGSFVLTNKLQNGVSFKPGLYFLALEQGGSFQVLIDQDQTFSMTTHVNDLVGAMQVEGSIDNEVLYESAKMEGDLQTQINGFNQQMKGQTLSLIHI